MEIGNHHSVTSQDSRLQRCSPVTSREPRRIVVTGVQLQTGGRRTHRRTPHRTEASTDAPPRSVGSRPPTRPRPLPKTASCRTAGSSHDRSPTRSDLASRGQREPGARRPETVWAPGGEAPKTPDDDATSRGSVTADVGWESEWYEAGEVHFS